MLSTKNLNRIIEFDDLTGVISCESGVILETLSNEAAKKGFHMPLDLGSKGSCMIGGNISTNAGGIKFVKYGSMHQNTVGLKVVLPNGEILDMMGGPQ